MPGIPRQAPCSISTPSGNEPLALQEPRRIRRRFGKDGTPNPARQQVLRNSFAKGIDCPRPIAVRNDTRIRHPDAKGIFAFLDIPRIHAREGDSNANLACAGLRVFHLTDDEYISRCALSLIPSGFHSLEFLTSSGARYDFVLQTGRSLACRWEE